MSVRAYKIIKKEIESDPTFNCWYDEWLIDLALNSDNYCDGGELEFCKEDIEDAIANETDKERLEVLCAVLADFDEGEEYISYDCY